MADIDVDPVDEVILLASDDSSAASLNDYLEWFDAQPAVEFAHNHLDIRDPLDDDGGQQDLHDQRHQDIIDLTALPDIDVPPSSPIILDEEDPEPILQARGHSEQAQSITEAIFLQMILDVLPDISVDHVLKLIAEKTTDLTRTAARCEHLITELLDGGAYPKEADVSLSKKRKRDEDKDLDKYDKYDKDVPDPEIDGYEREALDILKDEFLTVPVRHLKNVLKEEKTLYKAFRILEAQLYNYRKVATPFAKIAKARNTCGTELQLIGQGSQLPKELHAAKMSIAKAAGKRREAEETEQAEATNFQQAKQNGQIAECPCCCEEIAMNRTVSCDGEEVHWFCMECPKRQIENEMGQSQCRPKCFATSDCNGTFSRSQLQQILSETTFERLEHMQQMEDLKAADLDFLSECPFCDFRMECPPVEIDREFRCQSTKCGKTSCRLCQKESHIPLSCQEAQKDGQLTLRHTVEEAMSEALIRHCNQCKHPFVKEMGCNKMTCTHCRNVQCYVCSENVDSYLHFGAGQHGKCPLHENVEDRHEQEVKRAADEAMAKVRADNPELSEADLMIKVSDQVKQAEDRRRGVANTDANAYPHPFVNNQVPHRWIPDIQAGAHGVGPLPPPIMAVRPPALAYQQPQPGIFPNLVEPYQAAWNVLHGADVAQAPAGPAMLPEAQPVPANARQRMLHNLALQQEHLRQAQQQAREQFQLMRQRREEALDRERQLQQIEQEHQRRYLERRRQRVEVRGDLARDAELLALVMRERRDAVRRAHGR
ncbi:hypothetical protein ACN47E_005169 [Coniothyrium glycines]